MVMRAASLALSLLLISPFTVRAQASAPRVVIYLHGRIIEDQGPTAVSPTFGPYAFHAIVDSLRSQGATVIAELRPSGTDMDRYAEHVARQVDSLLRAGVAPSRITVVGFSKGGGIAIRASSRIGRPDIGFVFLAACGDGSPPPDGIHVAGRMLSIYEASDAIGRSCAQAFARARKGSTHAEVRISTGREHGAFFQPRAEWLQPLRVWWRDAG